MRPAAVDHLALARVALGAVLAALPACGSISTSDADAGRGPPDGGQDAGPADAGTPTGCQPGADPSYEEGWACARDAYCLVFSRCLLPMDLEDCRRTLGRTFEKLDPVQIEQLREAIEVGTVAYHPDRVSDCVTSTQAIECASLREEFADLCPIFSGTVADGDPCYTTIECATPGAVCRGLGCEVDDTCCQATCVRPADLLGECGENVPCAPGLRCVSGVCRTGEAGAPCADHPECDTAYWCDGDTCQPDLASGAPCMSDGQCPSPESCLGEALADAGTGTCGRSDRADDPCDGGCFGLSCVQGEGLGICTPLPRAGEICIAGFCHSSAICSENDQVCVARRDVGAPCTKGQQQCRLGFICDADIDDMPEGHCVTPREAGEHCLAASHCASAICDAKTQTCQEFPGCYP